MQCDHNCMKTIGTEKEKPRRKYTKILNKVCLRWQVIDKLFLFYSSNFLKPVCYLYNRQNNPQLQFKRKQNPTYQQYKNDKR